MALREEGATLILGMPQEAAEEAVLRWVGDEELAAANGAKCDWISRDEPH